MADELDFEVIEDGEEQQAQQFQAPNPGGVSFDPQMVAMAQALVQQIAPSQPQAPQTPPVWQDPLTDVNVRARLDSLRYEDSAAYDREYADIISQRIEQRIQPQMAVAANQGYIEQQLQANLPSIAFDPADIPALELERQKAIAFVRTQNPGLFSTPAEVTRIVTEHLDGVAARLARARNNQTVQATKQPSSVPSVVASSRGGPSVGGGGGKVQVPRWAVEYCNERGIQNVGSWWATREQLRTRGGQG